MFSTPCGWVCFTCKDQILKAIYMQIMNNFSGERKNQQDILPPLKNAFMHPSIFSQRACALTIHTLCSLRRVSERYPFDKEGFTHQANSCAEREARISKGQSGSIRAYMQVVAETDWQCHNRQEMFRCCPPSPRAALKPVPPPRWGSGAGDLRLWRV